MRSNNGTLVWWMQLAWCLVRPQSTTLTWWVQIVCYLVRPHKHMLRCWVYLACYFMWPSNCTQVWQVQLTVQEVGVSVAVEHPPLQSAGTLWPDAHCGHKSVCVDTYPGPGKHQGDHQQWESQVHVNKQQHRCSHHHSHATARTTPRSVLLPLPFANHKLFYRGPWKGILWISTFHNPLCFPFQHTFLYSPPVI